MNILVSNDDGIASNGIYALAQELKKVGNVLVVAPLSEQSAVGHAITMKMPLRVTKYFHHKEFFGYAVDGTPADCVKMGVKNLIPELGMEKPDVVVSGINHGSNTATNVIYSGTVSAAREAAIMDIPAIAVSITSHDADDFDYAARVAALFCTKIEKYGLKAGTLLNINVPHLPESEIKGIRITKQGRSKWDDVYQKRVDPIGKDYYWLTGALVDIDTEPDVDQYAVSRNYVSVSPIHFDLTDIESYNSLLQWDVTQ